MRNLLDAWFKIDLGEGAFKAVLGLAFVFAGILVLVGIFTLLGFVMKKINERREKSGETSVAPAVRSAAEKQEDEIPPEVVAAITAALMSYYQKENVKCDFVVKRIKRIERSQKDHA